MSYFFLFKLETDASARADVAFALASLQHVHCADLDHVQLSTLNFTVDAQRLQDDGQTLLNGKETEKIIVIFNLLAPPSQQRRAQATGTL